MKITNKFDLPEAVVRAIASDPYSRGKADFSVTGLIKPARIAALEAQHDDEIEVDATDRIWSLIGQAVHVIAERAEDPTAIREQRLFLRRGAVTISGKFDHLLLEAGRLTDFKVTNVLAVRDGGREEWTAQLNIYAHLLRVHGYEVKEAQTCAFLRDWFMRRAGSESYPDRQVAKLPVAMWSTDEILAYIDRRIAVHRAARKSLPDCTDEERWLRPGSWRVIKEGNVKATSVHPSFEEAFVAAKALYDRAVTGKGPKPIYDIKEVPGENVRCAFYCDAAPFCDQWRRLNPHLVIG
jgi:hypothetical protein